MSAKNQPQIDFIAACLRKGEKRNNILAKFGRKWQDVSERTFDRRLKDAEDVHAKEQALIQTKVSQRIETEVEARKGAIMDAIERQEVLTQIARGQIPLKKPMVCDGIIQEVDVVPDWMDRKNAIAELNKMTDGYTARKIEVTDKTLIIRPKKNDN